MVDGPVRATVLDPATGEPVGTCPLATPADVDAAVEAAERAFPAWSADPAARRAAMERAATAISAARDELATLLTREQGKPLWQAQREADRLALWLRYYAALDVPDVVLRDDPARRIVVTRRPLGVVAALMPWNFPLSLFGWKLAPALAAGDTIVARPSLSTPLATLRVGALLRDALPPGVLNVVAGRVDTAHRLVAHPGVRGIGFTGSTATGREIMAVAGPLLKRVNLELGGNDAAIVLDDAPLDEVAERLYWGAFYNSGQVCMAIKRLFVPRSLAGPLVEWLVDRATATRLGHGLDPATEMGPLQNAAQRDRVEALIRDATAAGARLAAGGRRPAGDGYFLEPAIVTDARPGQELVDDEQFGPALPVIQYDSIDDAVRMAVAGPYGLGLSVWTGDPERAHAIADRAEVGTVWINQHQEVLPEMPFGGAKDSGIGYEGGLPGLDAYVQLQVRSTWRA